MRGTLGNGESSSTMNGAVACTPVRAVDARYPLLLRFARAFRVAGVVELAIDRRTLDGLTGWSGFGSDVVGRVELVASEIECG